MLSRPGKMRLRPYMTLWRPVEIFLTLGKMLLRPGKILSRSGRKFLVPLLWKSTPWLLIVGSSRGVPVSFHACGAVTSPKTHGRPNGGA